MPYHGTLIKDLKSTVTKEKLFHNRSRLKNLKIVLNKDLKGPLYQSSYPNKRSKSCLDQKSKRYLDKVP